MAKISFLFSLFLSPQQKCSFAAPKCSFNYGTMRKLPVATLLGIKISLPAALPVSLHVPVDTNLIQRSSAVQTVGVKEVMVTGVVKPSVTDFEVA